MLVQNREYLHYICFEQEVNCIWESAQKNAPRVSVLRSIRLRDLYRPFYCRIEFQNKLNAQARLLRFIPLCCLLSVSSCPWLNVYLVQDLPSLVRSSSRTSLQGRPGSGLAPYSSNRSSRNRL